MSLSSQLYSWALSNFSTFPSGMLFLDDGVQREVNHKQWAYCSTSFCCKVSYPLRRNDVVWGHDGEESVNKSIRGVLRETLLTVGRGDHVLCVYFSWEKSWWKWSCVSNLSLDKWWYISTGLCCWQVRPSAPLASSSVKVREIPGNVSVHGALATLFINPSIKHCIVGKRLCVVPRDGHLQQL